MVVSAAETSGGNRSEIRGLLSLDCAVVIRGGKIAAPFCLAVLPLWELAVDRSLRSGYASGPRSNRLWIASGVAGMTAPCLSVSAIQPT